MIFFKSKQYLMEVKIRLCCRVFDGCCRKTTLGLTHIILQTKNRDLWDMQWMNCLASCLPKC